MLKVRQIHDDGVETGYSEVSTSGSTRGFSKVWLCYYIKVRVITFFGVGDIFSLGGGGGDEKGFKNVLNFPEVYIIMGKN